MANLLLPHRWHKQPQYPVELAQPYADYAAFCHIMTGPRFRGYQVARNTKNLVDVPQLHELDLAASNVGYWDNDLAWHGSEVGNVVHTDAGALNNVWFGCSGTSILRVPAQAEVSLFAFARYHFGEGVILNCRSRLESDPIIGLHVGDNGVDGGTPNSFVPLCRGMNSPIARHANGPIATDGRFHLFGVHRHSGNWWWSFDGQYGLFNVAPTNAQGVIEVTVDVITYGNDRLNSSLAVNAEIALGGMLIGYAMRESEIMELAHNPWQIFRPLKRRLFIQPTVGGAAQLELEGFRWRNDDGSESAATWRASQDTHISLPVDTPVRLRVIVNVAQDPAPVDSKYRLEARLGSEDWFAVNPAGPRKIRLSASTHIAPGGESTTAQLTPPSGKTVGDFVTGRIWDDESGQDTIVLQNGSYTELEWCIQAVSANGAMNSDVYQFRVTRLEA